MTKEEIFAQLPNLDSKQRNVVNRLFWAAEKKGANNKLASANTPEEVLTIVNSTFRKPHAETVVAKPSFNLSALSIEELENLLTEIPALIEQKKQEKLAEIDKQIEELKALKEELNKEK